MIKKFTTFLLAFAMVISLSVPRSTAVGLGAVVSSVTKYTLAAVGTELALEAIDKGLDSFFGSPQAKQFAQDLVADYIAAGFTDQDYYDQFTNYNAQLETDLGTTTIVEGGGIRNVFKPTGYGSFTRVSSEETSIELGGYSAHGVVVTNDLYSSTSADHTNNAVWQVWFDEYIEAPFAGSYRIGGSQSCSFNVADVLYTPPTFNRSGSCSMGDRVYPASYSYSGNAYHARVKFRVDASTIVVANFNVSCWVNFFPATGSLPTTANLAAPSRPTTLVTPIAIQNPDETYTVYNSITLVDEGNKVVFDPTTGESITFTDWAYDYESCTYDLTLDGGGNMTVQFGNDSITMTQGDTVTNIFYVQDPADDPGTDNPDNPGTDADVSGFFEWWKNAWNGFVDRLFTVLDGGDLEVILPGEGGNPEDEEDDGWTVFDLFALIRDALWKIITGVITVVLDGFLGLVDAIASLGDFFDIYDPANPNGIFGVPNGGVDLWS